MRPLRSLPAVCLLLVCGLPAVAAPPLKVLHVSFRTAETGFDPQRVDDQYSMGILENLFEPLLTYDYLARPVKLVPLTATAIPEPEDQGRSYTLHLRPGIYFASDPVFKGKKRELTARDVEYSIKRFRDPSVRSPYAWLFENRLLGLDELATEARHTGHFNYDTPVAGLEVLDRYTIRFRLRQPDYNFLYVLAMPIVVPVAREVIEAYAADTHAHPVGTGPFILKDWRRRSRIVLERNPDYRGRTLDPTWARPDDDWDQRVVRELAGKKLPLLDRVEIDIIETEQPRFLAYMNGEHDLLEEVPSAFVQQVLPEGRLEARLAARGVRALQLASLTTTYDLFNMQDPVVGGYTPERVALRRALALARDRGQAMPAQTVVPPGVVGYDATLRSPTLDFDRPRARALLDLYGYVDRDHDGWRDRPDGSPLTISYKYNAGNQTERQLTELWSKSLTAVNLRFDAEAVQFSDLLRDRKAGKYQMASAAWFADYPDAQNFLQLFYGPNAGQGNDTRFALPAYDRLYDAAQAIPDSPERNRLYREMNRLILAYSPVVLEVHRTFTYLVNPWVLGYKKHPIIYTNYTYLDLDVAAQQRGLSREVIDADRRLR